MRRLLLGQNTIHRRPEERAQTRNQKADDMGYKFNVGPELEFFLFHTDDEGRPTTKTHDKAGYFDLDNVDLGGDCRRDMCVALEDMGFEIEASHHECAEGQHEIDFKYGDVLSIADKVMTFKYVVKKYAQLHNLYATFMPKPIFGIAGSGMHTNMSSLIKTATMPSVTLTDSTDFRRQLSTLSQVS